MIATPRERDAHAPEKLKKHNHSHGWKKRRKSNKYSTNAKRNLQMERERERERKGEHKTVPCGGTWSGMPVAPPLANLPAGALRASG